ncbi:MAG: DegQ family serine endoprotease [Betaproteobacteria bacterium]|nr:DegQ family serine endoprotease [Betaproteobacteria bacterium]
MNIPRFRVAAAVVAIATGVGVALHVVPGAISPSHAQAQAQVQAGTPLVSGLPDFTGLVDAVGGAVVNISTVQNGRGRGGPQLDPDDPLHEFFRRFGVPTPDQQQRPSRGVGSGFIVSDDGYVLTNAHVVAEANEVTVKLTDKREFKAKVVGADKRTDVALIKIDARGLPKVRFGDAGRLRVGEWVAAIGSPFGFENSVTAGIVSAKSRALPDESFVPFIQTDVAINPGNSGGPLFNLAGEVVGINSQIYSRSGGYMGISFAIPIDVAMKVKDQLQKTGKVSRGKMGVSIQPVSRELAETFGLDKAAGALVAAVEPGSPAEKAGIQSGDIILAVNGTRVDDAVDLPRVIGGMRPGEVVNLKLWRQKASRDVKLTLAELSEEPVTAEGPAQGERKATAGKLGLALRPLEAAEARRLGVQGGLVVEGVQGAGARAGIQRGDVVLGVNNQYVADLDQFRRLVDAAGNRLALLVQRGSARLYVPIRSG